jgi:hypothetical protein
MADTPGAERAAVVTRSDAEALEEYAAALQPELSAAGGFGCDVGELEGVVSEASALTPAVQVRWLHANLTAGHMTMVERCTDSVQRREGPEWQKLADRLESLARRLRGVFASRHD